jgi:hypothetical protein
MISLSGASNSTIENGTQMLAKGVEQQSARGRETPWHPSKHLPEPKGIETSRRQQKAGMVTRLPAVLQCSFRERTQFPIVRTCARYTHWLEALLNKLAAACTR